MLWFDEVFELCKNCLADSYPIFEVQNNIAKKNVLKPELFLFRSGSRSGSSVRISAPEDGVDGNGSDEEYNGNFVVFMLY